MYQQSAFVVNEVLNLRSLQVDPRNLKFGVTSFESDRQITVRENDANGQPVLSTVDIASRQVAKKNIKAEMALSHPTRNVLALRAKKADNPGVQVVQVFDMDSRKKLKHLEVPENIVFWKWVTPAKLALVTASQVLQVNIERENEDSTKVMDRNGPLADAQIVGYQLDPQEKWAVLYGISTPDGGKTINGHIQLFLIESQKQQQLDGHCAVFGEGMVHDGHTSTLLAFVEKKPHESHSKVHITEISAIKEGTTKFKKSQELSLDQPNDFPIYMQISQKYGLLYVITKHGQMYVYELSTCQRIHSQKVCQNIVFVGCRNSANDGLYLINKEGSVMSVHVNPQTLVPFLLAQTHIQDIQSLAFTLAGRYSLPGCDQVFLDGFNQAMAVGDYVKAAQMAASAPGTLLRNNETLNKFKQLKPSGPNQPQPILQYFQTLLSRGKLNSLESVELCRPVLMQGKKQLVQQWLQENKLECSEELGDLVKGFDGQMALSIYEAGNISHKLQQVYMETGQLDKLMNTSTNVNYMQMIGTMIQQGNFEGALNSAKQVYAKNPGSLQVHVVGEQFMQAGRLQEMTAFLVDCMKGNKPEDGVWQTRVLEQNLMMAPQVAEAILQMGIWSQYDRQKVAQLCEQKMLFQRALENYQDIKDIKRAVLNTSQLPHPWLIQYLSNLDSDRMLTCLQEMVKHNRQNIKIAVQVAQQNYQKLNIASVVSTFEQVGSYEGVYYFLSTVIANTDDHQIHFKYLEAAVRCNQLQEVERVIAEKSDNYDPVQVKDFLMQQKLQNPKSLILLCDKHGYIEELTRYLFKNCEKVFIEIYLSKVNPQASPLVLGTLIDLECEENYLKQLLFNLRGLCPAEETVVEFEKRNKLRLLEKWLEGIVQMGNQQAQVHNAVAKLKIDMNQSPGEFLVQNQFYDSKVVGAFCEERDPHLAYVAYKRAWGTCDQELIELTNRNQMYRLQARYCVERMDGNLWGVVLSEENQYRANIIDQVVSQALPESKNGDEVVNTVQAFIAAGLHNDLISLLERIVLHNSEFAKIKKLQNLLILTSIRSDRTKVMDYVKRLDNYDGADIAEEAVKEEYGLYEEGFVIYDKFGLHAQALDTLINKLQDQQRAHEYANNINTPELWTILGSSHLGRDETRESMGCFLKAKNGSEYLRVIYQAEGAKMFEQLVQFLRMCRESVKDTAIDNSLAFCFASLGQINELEDLLGDSNSVDVLRVGDRCFEEGQYESARVLYSQTQNNSKIASCLIKLQQFSKAIEFAKRANTTRTWKEVCVACVEQQEYKLAAIAGLEVIVIADMLEDLIVFYEEMGLPEEIIMLLQNGVAMNKQNQKGIVTELGVLYAKYQSEKLMEHCKMHFNNINISKMLSVCYRYALWNESVYLHSNYDEYDKAVVLMMDHSPSAFHHTQFVSLLQKVSNSELFKKAILFYLDEQPMMLNDLLKNIHNKLDLSQTVMLLKKTGYIELVLPFLKQVQVNNNQQVNETLNEVFLAQEDYESLWKSIRNNELFDHQSLARQTEAHELVEFRRIAAYLYRKTQKYDQSIKLSLQDQTYRDAIETALESTKGELVEELLKFFIQNDLKEFFTVCTYTCYELIRPDVVLEYAWRHQMFDYAMPFMIQITKELTHKVDHVQKKAEEKEKKEKKQQQNQENKPLEGFAGINPMMDPLGGQLMLMNNQAQQYLITSSPQSMMDMNMMGTAPSMGAMSQISGMNMGMPTQQMNQTMPPQQNQFFNQF